MLGIRTGASLRGIPLVVSCYYEALENLSISLDLVRTKLYCLRATIHCCYCCLYFIFSANPVRRSKELRGGRRFSSLGFISAPFVLSEITIAELICLRIQFLFRSSESKPYWTHVQQILFSYLLEMFYCLLVSRGFEFAKSWHKGWIEIVPNYFCNTFLSARRLFFSHEGNLDLLHNRS